MSAAYCIMVEADPVPFDPSVNGQALARAALLLSAAANAQGVTPLIRFCGPDQWFAADDGLRTIHELLQLPEDEMQALGKGVREDLIDFARVLQLVKQAGLRWHLGIDR